MYLIIISNAQKQNSTRKHLTPSPPTHTQELIGKGTSRAIIENRKLIFFQVKNIFVSHYASYILVEALQFLFMD